MIQVFNFFFGEVQFIYTIDLKQGLKKCQFVPILQTFDFYKL